MAKSRTVARRKKVTKKINGKIYTQHSCKGGKSNAKKVRQTGKYASVRFLDGCTWVRTRK